MSVRSGDRFVFVGLFFTVHMKGNTGCYIMPNNKNKGGIEYTERNKH